MGSSVTDWEVMLGEAREMLLTGSPNEVLLQEWRSCSPDDWPVYLRYDCSRHEILFNVGIIQLYEAKLSSRLMEAISVKQGRLYSCDEIWDHMFPGESFDKARWRSVYEAAQRINRKVLKQLGLGEFLIIHKKTIQVAEKYLPTT